MHIAKSTVAAPVAAHVSLPVPLVPFFSELLDADVGGHFATAVTRLANRGARLASMAIHKMGADAHEVVLTLQSLMSVRELSVAFDSAGPIAGSFRARAVREPTETRFFHNEYAILATLARGAVTGLTCDRGQFFLTTTSGRALADPDDHFVLLRHEEGLRAAQMLPDELREVMDLGRDLVEVRQAHTVRPGEVRALELRWHRQASEPARVIRIGVDSTDRVTEVDVWRSPFRAGLPRYPGPSLAEFRRGLRYVSQVTFAMWRPDSGSLGTASPVTLVLGNGSQLFLYPDQLGHRTS